MQWLRFVVLGLVTVFVAAGCRTAPAAPPDPVQARLGEVFTLSGGQQAEIADEGLRVTFDQVLADSRCPSQVDCAWTGEARIAVLVQQGTTPPETVEFNTNPAPGQTNKVGTVGPYTVELTSLDPYPETPADIPFPDYRAALLVTKQ